MDNTGGRQRARIICGVWFFNGLVNREAREIKKDLLDRVADFYSRSRPESLLRALTRKYRRDV